MSSSTAAAELLQACCDGNLHLVKKLVGSVMSRSKRLVNSRDEKGWTPVLLAGSQGHWEVVALLLKHGARADDQVTGKSASESTLLHYLCSHPSPVSVRSNKKALEAYEKLLVGVALTPTAGGDPLVLVRNRSGETCFHRLALHNNKIALRLMVPPLQRFFEERRVSVQPAGRRSIRFPDVINARDRRQWTPLTVAIASRATEVVTALLSFGVDCNCVCRLSDYGVAAAAAASLNATVDLVTPVQLASVFGSSAAEIKNVLAQQREADSLALKLAAVGQRTQFLDLFKRCPSIVFSDDAVASLPLTPTSELASPNGEGLGPLHYFSIAGDAETLKVLLPVCSRELIDRADLRGWTPLCHACYSASFSCIDVLLQYGATAAPAPRLAQALMLQRTTERSAAATADPVAAAASGPDVEPSPRLSSANATTASPDDNESSTKFLNLQDLQTANESARNRLLAGSAASSSSPMSHRRRLRLPSIAGSDDGDGVSSVGDVNSDYFVSNRWDKLKWCGPSGDLDFSDDEDDDDDDDGVDVVAALVRSQSNGWALGESVSSLSDSLVTTPGRSPRQSQPANVSTPLPDDREKPLSTATAAAAVTMISNQPKVVGRARSLTSGQPLHFGRHLPTPFCLHHFVKRPPSVGRKAEYESLLNRLIQANANPNLKSKYGDTALHTACFSGNIVAVQFLLNLKGKHACDVNAVNQLNETALHNAARQGNPKLVELLLAAGANPLVRASGSAVNPEFIEDKINRRRTVDMSFSKVDVSVVDENNRTMRDRKQTQSLSSIAVPTVVREAIGSAAAGVKPERKLDGDSLSRRGSLRVDSGASVTGLTAADVALDKDTFELLAANKVKLVHLPVELLLRIFSEYATCRDDVVRLHRVCKRFYDAVHDAPSPLSSSSLTDLRFRRAMLDLRGQSRRWLRFSLTASLPPPDFHFKLALVGPRGQGHKQWLMDQVTAAGMPSANRTSNPTSFGCFLAKKRTQQPLAFVESEFFPGEDQEIVVVQVVVCDLEMGGGNSSNLFRGTQGFMICLDIDEKEEFRSVEASLHEIERYGGPGADIILIGMHSPKSSSKASHNNSDIIEQLSLHTRLPFFEACVGDGRADGSVLRAFESLIDRVHLRLTDQRQYHSQYERFQQQQQLVPPSTAGKSLVRWLSGLNINKKKK